jgi:LmbE family N-acetylglucosaminyl deacetylase
VLVQALCEPDASVAAIGRVLVVVAHPDDETVGAGSRLPLLRSARFVYATDGAPGDGLDAARHGLSIDAYREVRRRERAAALALCGIGEGQVVELGCPDQQAARRLPLLAMRLADLFTAERPHAVLTHPCEGGHPDHDATAFAVHAARQWLRQRGQAAPDLVEMASYHRGEHGLRSGAFLPHAAVDQATGTVVLDSRARAFKQALLDCHGTQRETLRQFPLDRECFRPAPPYDFGQAPHAGPLFYEEHGWGVGGEEFRALALQACGELGLEPSPWP